MKNKLLVTTALAVMCSVSAMAAETNKEHISIENGVVANIEAGSVYQGYAGSDIGGAILITKPILLG